MHPNPSYRRRCADESAETASDVDAVSSVKKERSSPSTYPNAFLDIISHTSTTTTIPYQHHIFPFFYVHFTSAWTTPSSGITLGLVLSPNSLDERICAVSAAAGLAVLMSIVASPMETKWLGQMCAGTCSPETSLPALLSRVISGKFLPEWHESG